MAISMTSNWTLRNSIVRVARDARVVGGQPALPGEFPHQVAITYNDDFICGGSIISPLLVLTAAHCLFSSLYPNILHFKVVAGLRNINDFDVGEQIRNIKSFYKHKAYERETFQNDIAIIVLDEPLNYNDNIKNIMLPRKNEVFQGYATVSGWGATEWGGRGALSLRKVSVPIVSREVCQVHYQGLYDITSDMICMGGNGKDTCQGDSGGAAICKRCDSTIVQCGIVSFGRGCAREDNPGVYTHVGKYIDWIENTRNEILLVASRDLTFTNPIFGEYSADPCVAKVGDYYYLTLQNRDGDLAIYKSRILTSFRGSEKKVLLKGSGHYLTPSQMVEINGALYLYFRMRISVGYRVHVMKAYNAQNPMEGWSEPLRMLHDWDHGAIDGAVMKHNNQLYFVWTILSSSYSLFIAPMKNPTWVGDPKVLLREPKETWECNFKCVNEGATFLYRNNVSYLIFSAEYYFSPDYCLGQMNIAEGADPLVIDNWRTTKGPVFWRNNNEDVYAMGRAKFIESPDGTETWMVYHATISPIHIRSRQTARLDKIEWNADGNPIFPRPLGNHQPRSVPSGQVLSS